jgi:hypothetical protein
MILWQFVTLIVLLIVGQWAAEVRDSKRNARLDSLLQQLADIEKQLNPITDLPADIARAIHRETDSRREYALTTGTEKP